MGMNAYIGDIMVFAGNFAPRGWTICDGKLLPISSYTAVFSILGTIYGGDGRTTFGVPDLQGRLAVHGGTGPGLTPRRLGQKGGQTDVALSIAELGSHTHSANVSSAQPSTAAPDATVVVARGEGRGAAIYSSSGTNATNIRALDTYAGQSQPHTNMQPYLPLVVCLCLEGEYPSRS